MSWINDHESEIAEAEAEYDNRVERLEAALREARIGFVFLCMCMLKDGQCPACEHKAKIDEVLK